MSPAEKKLLLMIAERCIDGDKENAEAIERQLDDLKMQCSVVKASSPEAAIELDARMADHEKAIAEFRSDREEFRKVYDRAKGWLVTTDPATGKKGCLCKRCRKRKKAGI